MQFRKVGNKVQCLVSVYDPASKRTRQKMVYSLDTWRKNVAPEPDALSAGTAEQRAVWAQEIAAHMAEGAREEGEARVRGLPLTLRNLVNQVVHDLNSQSSLLTDDARSAMKAEASRLLAALDPKPETKGGRNPAGRKGVDDAVKLRAQELRKTMPISQVAATLVEEGHSVSKSWVQKWTS